MCCGRSVRKSFNLRSRDPLEADAERVSPQGSPMKASDYETGAIQMANVDHREATPPRFRAWRASALAAGALLLPLSLSVVGSAAASTTHTASTLTLSTIKNSKLG